MYKVLCVNECEQVCESSTKTDMLLESVHLVIFILYIMLCMKKKIKIKRETQGGYNSVTYGDTIHL